MHNSQQLFTCIVTILSVLLILSCSQKPPSEKIAIRWETILHSPKEIDYCEINPGFTANELLISYSHSFAIGGGFKIIKTNFRSDGLDVDVLLERENNVISHVTSGQGSIACIQHDFENKTLRTSLLVAEDSTYSWSIIDTPVAGL